MLGNGASFSAEFWQYDSRLGRRWNVDPVFKEYESPYACFAGNPVWFADTRGKDGRVTYTETENGGDIVVETKFSVYGKGAEIAVKNAKEQFAKLNTSTSVVIDGKTYNIRLNITWEVRQELADMDIENMDYADLQSIEGYKERVIANQTLGTNWPVHKLGLDINNPKQFHILLRGCPAL